MIPKEISYPVFEANQVLTNNHLNAVRDYLDEQHRLSRANLHGTGVVCGLEISATGTVNHQTVVISRGCGITSEGYLVVVGDGAFLADRRKDYKAPDELAYPLFTEKSGSNKGKQYPMFELLDKSHDDYDEGTQLTEAFLKDKVILLFLELAEEDLKNCSPASCDDKGAQVNVTVRKLAVAEDDLKKINAEIAANLEKDKLAGDFFPDLEGRIDLPDLRLPRLDVPNSNMQDGQAIFSAYKKLLTGGNPDLFGKLEGALTEAWKVFQPVVQEVAKENPFAGSVANIRNQFVKMTAGDKVIFSQYYYDLMDDLLQAYEEFRWKGLELMALCCPPAGLHPRHLMLGETTVAGNVVKQEFRHYFRPSPAHTGQAKLRLEVLHLFQRLVLMVKNFNEPNKPSSGQSASQMVRITPTHYGTAPLSGKCIPYYFNVDAGTPALYERWDFKKTSTGRARQNTSYSANTYAKDDFVKKPLEYDLEGHNFFRIEGHIGFSWRTVLSDLLKKIESHRLPFDVIVLNADNKTVKDNPWLNRCITDDLQVIYNSWMKEAECLYKDKMKYLTGLQIFTKVPKDAPRPGAGSIAAFSGTHSKPAGSFFASSAAPAALKINVVDSVVKDEGTLGSVFTEVLEKPNVNTASDIKINITNAIKEDEAVKNLSVQDYDLAVGKRVDVIAALYDFTESIPESASTLNFAKVNDKYGSLLDAVKNYHDLLDIYKPPADNPVITQAEKDEILKQLKTLLNNCLQDRLKELQAEINRRKQQVEELLYFSRYVKKHPDIQHKAGVPVGGTFILVFEESPPTFTFPKPGLAAGTNFFTAAGSGSPATPGGDISTINPNLILQPGRTFSSSQIKLLSDAFSKIGATVSPGFFDNLGLLAPGVIPVKPPVFTIPDGVVIADFFVPYRCCSDCPPVHFVLPPERPVFEIKQLCPDENGEAIVEIDVVKGTAPFEVRVDDGEFQPLKAAVNLNLGKHTLVIQDAEGGVSLPKEVEILPSMSLDPGEITCADDNQTYTVKIFVANGKLPLFIDGKEVEATPDPANPNAHTITAGPLPSGQLTTIMVSDSSVCPPEELEFEHTCESGTEPPVANPDETETAFMKEVTVDVLANDTGNGIKVTSAELSNANLGQVTFDNNSITYIPSQEVSGRVVKIKYEITDAHGNTASSILTVHVGAAQ